MKISIYSKILLRKKTPDGCYTYVTSVGKYSKQINMQTSFVITIYPKTKTLGKRLKVQVTSGKNKHCFFLKEHEARHFIGLIDNQIF